MRQALAEAGLAGQAGELPPGAVLVIDGQIVERAIGPCAASLATPS